MNKHLIVHGLWLLVAVTAFVLGGHFYGSSGTAGDEESNSLPSSKSAGESWTASSSGGNPRGTGAAGRDDRRAGRNEAGVAPLSEEEITRLGEEFRKASSPIDRRLAFSKLLEGLTSENALEIREQIEHLHHHSAEFREFHYAWGSVAGEEAVMMGLETKDQDDMTPALAGWAATHPGAARIWLEHLDPENDARFAALVKEQKISGDDLRNHLMGGLVYGLADADPNVATEFLHASITSMGQERAGGLMNIVADAVLRGRSLTDAADWAEDLPDTLRGQAMERVADRFVDVDPAAAATWAEGFNGEPEGAGVIGEVGANWAWRDPQAALSWLEGLPASDGQSEGMARALGAWAHRDLTAAGEHLQTMSDSPARDAAVRGYSQRVAWEDPQAALGWAETITTPDQRREAIIGVGRAWNRRDSDGAASWLNSADLPEDMREAILSAPRPGRD